MSYDNAAYLKDRYRLLRRVGLCVDCKGASPHAARCGRCRSRVWSWRRLLSNPSKRKAA